MAEEQQSQQPQDPQLNFKELFEFLTHEREDVRHLAAQGVADHSDDADLIEFLLAPDSTGLQQLADLVNVKNIKMLGQLLTALINLSADPKVSEAMLSRKVLDRTVRTLEGLERTEDHSRQRLLALKELSLMLLNNLTSTHVIAIDQLMQIEDDDLAGYTFSKMKTLFDRAVPEEELTTGDIVEPTSEPAAPKAEAASASAAPGLETTTSSRLRGGSADAEPADDDEAEEQAKEAEELARQKMIAKATASGPAARKHIPGMRDLRGWYLKVCLNCTRAPLGRKVVLDDDDWLQGICELIAEDAAPLLRMLAIEIMHNCAAEKEYHPKLAEIKVAGRVLARLDAEKEKYGETQLVLAETVAAMMATEQGMSSLEDFNAKKHLEAAVEGLDEEAQRFVKENILPFLDDIQDVYVVEGKEGEAA